MRHVGVGTALALALAATAAARAPVTSAAPSRGLEVRFLVTAAQAESLVPGNLRRTLAQLRPHARGAVRGVRGDVAKTAALRDLVRRSIAPGATGCYGYATILNALGRGLGLPVRLVAGTAGFSDLDTHTTVEVWSAVQRAWVIEDPTFGGTFAINGSDLPVGATQLRDVAAGVSHAVIAWRSSHVRYSSLPSAYYVDPVYLFRYVGVYARVGRAVMPVVLPDSAMLSSGVAVVSERTLANVRPQAVEHASLPPADWIAARPTLLAGPPSYAGAEVWAGTVALPATLDVGAQTVVVWASAPGVTVSGDSTALVNGGSLSPIVAGGRIAVDGTGSATLHVYVVRRFPARLEH